MKCKIYTATKGKKEDNNDKEDIQEYIEKKIQTG